MLGSGIKLVGVHSGLGFCILVCFDSPGFRLGTGRWLRVAGLVVEGLTCTCTIPMVSVRDWPRHVEQMTTLKAAAIGMGRGQVDSASA